MSAKAQRPPSGEPWIWLTRELVASPAWQSLGINARRVIDFLLLEHMRRGGQRNGFLMAPRSQLEAFGIGARHVSSAIDEIERVGLVDCRRGSGRRSSAYSLTWLPPNDGTEPSNRWRSYAPFVEVSEGKSLREVSEGIPLGYPKGSHKARRGIRREVTSPKLGVSESAPPYRKASYHGGAEQGAAGEPRPAGLAPAPHVVSPAPAPRPARQGMRPERAPAMPVMADMDGLRAPSNRQIAEVLGVHHATVGRDIGANAPQPAENPKGTATPQSAAGANAPPPALSGADAAQAVAKVAGRRDAELVERPADTARAERLVVVGCDGEIKVASYAGSKAVAVVSVTPQRAIAIALDLARRRWPT